MSRFLAAFNINNSNLLRFPVLFAVVSEDGVAAFEKSFEAFVAVLRKQNFLICTPMSTCYLLDNDPGNGFSYTINPFPKVKDGIVRIEGRNWQGISQGELRKPDPDQMNIMLRVLARERKRPDVIAWEKSEKERRSRPLYDVSTGT